jgi:hypothetical protein
MVALDSEHPNPFLVHRGAVIEGPFTPAELVAALRRVIPAHAMLRTRWIESEGALRLRDVPTQPEELLIVEDGRDGPAGRAAAADGALQDIAAAFEASEPLCRFHATRVAGELWILHVTAHPVAADDLSLELLLETLRETLEHVPKADCDAHFVRSVPPPVRSGPNGRIPTAGAVQLNTLDRISSGHLRDLCRAAGVTLFHGLVALTSGWLACQNFAESDGSVAIWRPTECVDQTFGRPIHPHFVRFPAAATLSDRFGMVTELCTATVDDAEQASRLRSLAEHPVAAGMTWEVANRGRDSSSRFRFQPWPEAAMLCPFRWNFAFSETGGGEIACRLKFRLLGWNSLQAGDVLRDWKRFVQSARMSGFHGLASSA